MANNIHSKYYLKDPLFTRTVNAIMQNPTAPVNWKGKLWSVGQKLISNNKKFNPAKLFFSRRFHAIKLHYSKKYRQRFTSAIDTLKEALKADKEMKKLQKIDKLTKKYSKLKDKISKYEELQILKQKNILVLKRAIKAEESSFQELINEKINLTTTLDLLKEFKEIKQLHQEQLSVAGNTNGVVAGMTGIFWNAVGMPTNEIVSLKKKLDALQQELNLLHSYPTLITLAPAQLDLLIKNKLDEIDELKRKFREKDSTLLEKLQDEIKTLRKAKEDDEDKLCELRKEKTSLAKSLAAYGYLDTDSTVEEMNDGEDCSSQQTTPLTSENTNSNSPHPNDELRKIIDTHGNPQLYELLDGLFSHLSRKLNDTIIDHIEENGPGKISLILKEPVRFWVSSKTNRQKDAVKGGAIFSLGNNAENKISLQISSKEVNFYEGITCFCRTPETLHKFLPPLLKSRVKHITINVRSLTFDTPESVSIRAGVKILKYKHEESRHADFKTLLTNWAKESTVITDRKKPNDAFIADMIEQDL